MYFILCKKAFHSLHSIQLLVFMKHNWVRIKNKKKKHITKIFVMFFVGFFLLSNWPLHDLDLQTPSLFVSLTQLLAALFDCNLLFCILPTHWKYETTIKGETAQDDCEKNNKRLSDQIDLNNVLLIIEDKSRNDDDAIYYLYAVKYPMNVMACREPIT